MTSESHTPALDTGKGNSPAPDTVSLNVEDMTVRQGWASGSSHDIHFRANTDLSVQLKRGGVGIGHNGGGFLLVGLNVDGEDFDVVEYETAIGQGSAEGKIEMLRQAVESLQAAEAALRSVARA